MDINQKQKERLEQQFAFIREIDKEKFIGRQTYLTRSTHGIWRS